MGMFPVNSERRSSELSDAGLTDFEPVVLSYAQFRNRECLRAWRRRHREHQEHQAAAAADGTLDLKWWPRAHG
jgi:hypothetical protein